MRVLVLLLLLGCAPQIQLESDWAPCTELVQDATVTGGPGFTRTVAPVCRTADLAAWQQLFPLGSVQRRALAAHEALHARRQLAMGVLAWTLRYQTDREFRWQEEQLGYALQIKTLLAGGLDFDNAQVATMLSTDYAGMVTYADALAWVQAQRP